MFFWHWDIAYALLAYLSVEIFTEIVPNFLLPMVDQTTEITIPSSSQVTSMSTSFLNIALCNLSTGYGREHTGC